ncbi:MAG: tRNA lysidine(34) synthetase TilS [Urechidicola sp.]|nr:tRNA lysidine(34) synthetase TilS [Urechidicola sp.]
MLNKFQNHINHKFPFLKDAKLLIAISGGIDSVVLTHLLHQLNFDISLAHCNFQLRGNESDLDEEFIKKIATNLDISYHTISFDTNAVSKEKKISTQMAARDLRYHWFDNLIEKNNYDYVLTAHQKDDVLETFLINFTRGTGLDGLTGIPEINKNIVRPLLSFTRNDIESFAKENNISWREDKSNASTKYLRNKIRHDVIPVLKEINPSLMDSFDSTIENLKGSKAIVKDVIESINKKATILEDNILKIDIEKIKFLSNTKAYLFELLKEYMFTEWNDVVALLNSQSGKQIFSKTHRLIKDRKHLLLVKIDDKDSNQSYTIHNFNADFTSNDFTLEFKLDSDFEQLSSNKNSVSLDFDLLTFPLTIRKWQHGDFFYPNGMKGKKKLSDFFNDEKMSILEKEKTWILTTSKNEIIWVVNKRLDKRFQISSATKKAVSITL